MIFVDTSFWIGLSDVDDDRHDAASALLNGRKDAMVVTTNHVVGETWTVLRRRHSHAVASTFLDRMERSGRLETAFVSADLEDSAWAWLKRHDERAYSFVDATSFALMRHRHITEALAFDGDFAAAGFVELRP